MKIAFIIPSLLQSGPVIVVRDLVKVMQRNSHHCKVFYFDDLNPIEFECETQKISMGEPINFLEFDVVHSHGYRPDSYVSRFREYSGRVRYVTTLHNYVFGDLKFRYNIFVAQVMGRVWMKRAKKFDTIVALSKDAQSYYKRKIGNHRCITYAYNSREVDFAKTLTREEQAEIIRFKDDSILIGINGISNSCKGLDFIISAMDRLPQFKLFIAGRDGKYCEKMKELARQKGVYDRCYFAGFRQDAQRYLPYYDIFALPSRSEGFPLALLEAAAYGKRCVTSNLPIIIETFGEEVEWFDLKRPETIVDAFLRASTNDSLEQAIKQKSESYYSLDSQYSRYIDIYKDSIDD